MFVSFGTKFVKNGPGKTDEQRQKKWVSTPKFDFSVEVRKLNPRRDSSPFYEKSILKLIKNLSFIMNES